jgi:hypothetical protein
MKLPHLASFIRYIEKVLEYQSQVLVMFKDSKFFCPENSESNFVSKDIIEALNNNKIKTKNYIDKALGSIKIAN